MKGKLDVEKLKELCLNHFEKVIFGVLVLVFLMMVASTMNVKSYSKKPEQLSSLCNQAKSQLEKVQEVQPVTRSFDSIVTGIQEHLPDTDYVTAVSWNPILSKESQKRKSPRVLTIQNLVAKEWHGGVQKPQRMNGELLEPEEPMMDDGFTTGRANNTEGVRCCVLIGELPLADQELEYQRKLGTRGLQQMRGGMDMNASTDAPTYYNYTVERALVPADGDLAKINSSDWIDLRKKQGKKLSVNETIIRKYAGDTMNRGGGDMTDMYSPPSLYRYPSLADDPKARTKNTPGRTNPRMAMMDPSGMTANGLVPSKDTMLVPLPQVTSSNQQMQFNWNTYLPYPESFELDRMDGRFNRRRPAPGTEPPADAAQNPTEVSEDGEAADEYNDEELETVEDPMNGNFEQEQSKIRLFRYVDYTVEEGKQYVYRVKVQVHNPNYEFDPPFNVENPDDRKPKYLESDWSNVSSPVAIPLDNHFYLAGYRKKFSRKKDKESPYLSLMPVRFNETTGDEDFTYFNQVTDPEKEKEYAQKSKKKKSLDKDPPQRLIPGQVLNLMVDELEIRQLGNNMDRGMSQRPRYKDEEEERSWTPFKTNFILLDARGGSTLYEPLTEKELEGAAQEIKNDPDGVYSPSMVLLMGPKGNLVIQSELEDVPNVYRRRDPADMNRIMEETSMRPEDPTLTNPKTRRRGSSGSKKDSLNRLDGEMNPRGSSRPGHR